MGLWVTMGRPSLSSRPKVHAGLHPLQLCPIDPAAACPAGITPLLWSCLRPNPTERPTFDALVATLDSLSATPDRLARALAERAASADEAVGGGPAPIAGPIGGEQGAAVPGVLAAFSSHTVQ